MTRTFVLKAFLVALTASTAQYVSAAPYSFVDLGLGGAKAINNSGVVVGHSYSLDTSASYAAMFSAGTTTLLDAANEGYAMDINSSGQIAGYHLPGGQFQAFSYASGMLTTLNILGNDFATTEGINDLGQIVGSTRNGGGPTEGYVYDNGTVQTLGNLGTANTVAKGINNAGQIVGNSDTAILPFNPTHAFLYEGGSMTDLGTLGGSFSSAFAINAAGDIVGSAETSSEVVAFLYTGGAMHDLGNLGVGHATATSINNQGQIVGLAGGFGARAFLYENGSMVDLNTLVDLPAGWHLSTAWDINDLGQIVGDALDADGMPHAFLLNPVPEPSSIMLAGLALTGLVVLVSRRGRSAPRSRDA